MSSNFSKLVLSVICIVSFSGVGCKLVNTSLTPTTSSNVASSTVPVVPDKPGKLAGFLLLNPPNRNFSIEYPATWEKNFVDSNANHYKEELFTARVTSTRPIAYVELVVSPANKLTQVELNKKLEARNSKFGKSTYTVATMAGHKDAMHVVSNDPKTNSPTYGEAYIIVNNDWIYSITYKSYDGNYAEEVKVFERMLATLKLL